MQAASEWAKKGGGRKKADPRRVLRQTEDFMEDVGWAVTKGIKRADVEPGNQIGVRRSLAWEMIRMMKERLGEWDVGEGYSVDRLGLVIPAVAEGIGVLLAGGRGEPGLLLEEGGISPSFRKACSWGRRGGGRRTPWKHTSAGARKTRAEKERSW